MKVLLLTAVLSVALSASSGPTLQDLNEWELYKVEYMKEYPTEAEEVKRRNIFLNNLNNVRQHNLKYESGEVSHKEGINAFSDKTPEEIIKMLNCRTESDDSNQGAVPYENTYNDVPKDIDWRKKGAVTEVLDQGDCGSCWAFAATGSLEGMTFVKTNKLVPLSQQNLLDCDKLDHACEGGNEKKAYTFIAKNGGIDTGASYPYKAVEGDCKFNPANVGATVTNHTVIPNGNEDQIKQVVGGIGPTTVAVAANPKWAHYKSGVFKDCVEGAWLNHAITAVGYGTTNNGEDYWLVKNSWGKNWGMQGYMMLARGKNMCGVAEQAVYPLV